MSDIRTEWIATILNYALTGISPEQVRILVNATSVGAAMASATSS